MQNQIILTKMAAPDCKDAPDTPEDVEALVDNWDGYDLAKEMYYDEE